MVNSSKTGSELLSATELRRGEMQNLLVSDIDFKDKTILIQENKGSIDRRIPVNDRALFWLNDYLNQVVL